MMLRIVALLLFFIIFKDSFVLEKREQARAGEGQRARESRSQADSPLSMVRTLRSEPEPRSRVGQSKTVPPRRPCCIIF